MKLSALSGLWGSAGLALAVSLSVMLRTLDYGMDYSLTIPGAWTGLVFGLSLGWLLLNLDLSRQPPPEKKLGGTTPAIRGFFPHPHPGLVCLFCSRCDRPLDGRQLSIDRDRRLPAGGWLGSAFACCAPGSCNRSARRILVLWNLAFTICLTGTILAHSVAFPLTPGSAPVVIGPPAWWQGIPLMLMLLLFPVVFLDLAPFPRSGYRSSPAPRHLLPGILLGALVLILLVFSEHLHECLGLCRTRSAWFFAASSGFHIFLPAGVITLLDLALVKRVEPSTSGKEFRLPVLHWTWALLLALVFLGTLVRLLPAKHLLVDAAGRTSLLVMTFNIQGANDGFAQKSYDRQLALIRSVSPDILSLQETDYNPYFPQ